GTADDLPVSGGTVSYRADTRAASLNFASPLPNGLYRAVVTTSVGDVAGNRLPAEYTWNFHVADAVFWSSGIDGFWEDPTNWSTGAIPGPEDNVIIDVVPGDLTITHAMGADVIKSLVACERLEMAGGSLQVTGASQFHQDVTLSGGILKGA